MMCSLPINVPSAKPPEESRPVSTAQLFGIMTIVSLALVWANNEFVMTKEVLLALAGDPQNTIQVEMQFAAVQQMHVWGYVFAPLQTALSICFVALVIQMMSLLGGIEIGFGKVFRISTSAFGAILFGSLLQIVWIVRQPTHAVSRASLGIVPDSFAAWFGTSNELPSFFYLVLSRMSITSLLWMLLIYWGLRESDRLKPMGATITAVGTWAIVSALHVATSMSVRGLVSHN